MGSGNMKYDYGVCGECNYTIEELVEEVGPHRSAEVEATANLLALPNTNDHYLIVTPHRTWCSFHTKQAMRQVPNGSGYDEVPQGFIPNDMGRIFEGD